MKLEPKRALYMAVNLMMGTKAEALAMCGGDEEAAKEVGMAMSAIQAYLYEAVCEKWVMDGVSDEAT